MTVYITGVYIYRACVDRVCQYLLLDLFVPPKSCS